MTAFDPVLPEQRPGWGKVRRVVSPIREKEEKHKQVGEHGEGEIGRKKGLR